MAAISLDKHFYINVGPGGTFKASGNADYDTRPSDVDKLVQDLQTKNITHIALYFHGGLVNEENGMESAKRLTNRISTDTAIHPIAFVWETGFMETLKANVNVLYHMDLFQKLLMKVIKIAAPKLGLELPSNGETRGIGTMPEAEIQAELNSPRPFENIKTNSNTRSVNTQADLAHMERQLQQEVDGEISRDFTLRALINSEHDKSLLDVDKLKDPSPGQGTRGILSFAAVVKAVVKIIYRVVLRVHKKRDHGFYPTVIEELLREIMVASAGAWIWKEMKDKAEDMWRIDPPDTATFDQHAGNYLLHSLEKYATESGNNITLDLIGHSAGSIVIAQLMKALAVKTKLKVRNIIYLAPAITCELFRDNVIKQKNNFKFFRMFTMSDAYETKDNLLSFVYPRSLLYFISGVLEGNGKSYDEFILGLQHHIDGLPQYSQEQVLNEVRTFIALTPNTSVYSLSAADATAGLQSLSQHHGDFDDDLSTLQSLIHILNQP